MRAPRWPSWSIAVTVLFAGLTNAHSHVRICLDGQEAPAAAHFADGLDAHHHFQHGDHHDADHHAAEHSGDAAHDDLDVDVPNDALAKTLKYDLPAIAPVQARLHPLVLTPARIALAGEPEPHSSPPPFARPQLRAPPR